jgi:hypothetical protein
MFRSIHQTGAKSPTDQIPERGEKIWAPPLAATVYRIDKVERYVAAEQTDVVNGFERLHNANIVSGNNLGKGVL